MALDERLRRGLEEAGRPADPSGVYEDLIRRRERRRITRRTAKGVLTLAVLAGCVIGVVLLASVFADAPTRPAATAGEGILFEDVVGQSSDLFVVQPDGSGLKQLTTTGDAGSGAWSPDGTRIVFPRDDERIQSADLFVMDSNGSDVVRLTETPELSEGRARWSPDGSQIVFEAGNANGSSGIYVMDADGGNARRLTLDGTSAGSPDWSPDGSRIVFVSGPWDPAKEQGTQIWIMNADGSDPHPITGGPGGSAGVDYTPRWSPDGRSIVFTRGRDVYVVEIDGSGLTNLTPESGTDFYDRDAAWSSDGSRIVFASTRSYGDSLGLFTMNADGTDVRPVIDRAIGFCCPEPDWRGDARSDTGSIEPEPSATPTPSTGEDFVLGSPVCNVTSIDGEFAESSVTSKMYVATFIDDAGGCPQPDEGINVIALDADLDGRADTQLPEIECELECRAFSAPDLDGDGTAELLVVQSGGSVVGLHLYDVLHSGEGELAIWPVRVAEPGDRQGRLVPGAETSFLLGGDAFELYTLRCGSWNEGVPALIVTLAESLPHDSRDAEWHAHEVTLVLQEDGLLHVVDVREFTEPVTDDPGGPTFASDETLCGSNLGPVLSIP